MRFLATLTLVVLPAGMSFAAPLVQGDRPNVLMIVVDDLNDWVVGFGGNEQSITPNIDRLGKRGLRFTNAHCNYTLCNPSRASAMTGFLPSSSGVWGNFQDWRKARPLRGKPTLPETFRRAGYFTGAAGKIFHANHGGPEGGLTGGHGGRTGFNHPPSWTERYPSHQVQIPDLVARTGQNWNGLDIWHWDWGPLDHPDAATADGRCAGWIVEQLKRKHSEPFFLALGVYAPHGPWYAPRKYFDQHPVEGVEIPTVQEDDLDDVPAVAKGHVRNNGGLHGRVTRAGLWQEAVQAYLAQVTFADATIGGVLDALDASEYAENTIIVLWSDHGWYLGEKQRWHKGGLWEEATRVPFLVVAPGTTQPGSECVRPVSLVDLYPTLLELCGLEERDDLDGESLRPLLEEPTTKWDHAAVTVHGGDDKASYAVRTERWRYIRYHDGSEELYDHDADSNEWTNLADRPEHAEVKTRLAKSIPTEFVRASRSLEKYEPLAIDGLAVFPFEDGDVLAADRSPKIAGTEFSVGTQVAPSFPSGVIAAQGGPENGWALVLDSHRPVFIVRRNGKVQRVEGPELIRGGGEIVVEVSATGTVEIGLHEGEFRKAEVGPFTAQPKVGVSVGLPSKVVDDERMVGLAGEIVNVMVSTHE